MIICADTVVVITGEQWEILEKPKDREHARKMMEMLSGNTHQVITAVTIILPKSNQVRRFQERTTVIFGDLSSEEIECYIQTDEP